MNIDLITMGCSKNLVDSEELITLFAENGIKVYHNPDKTHGGYAIINTCGFIADAKEESINMILELCRQKEQGLLRKVIVMGCLSGRYAHELEDEIPQVDKFYGKFNWKDIIRDINAEYNSSYHTPRVLTTPKHYAYIKIAEGCDRRCAYCAIPIMTGKHRSRKMEDIIAEVERLVATGTTEFQIIEQELTYYGIDLYHQHKIAELVERIAKVDGVKWLRLHYAYPNNFPLELLPVIRDNDNVCKYLDIALQHISDNMLSRMHRHVTKQQTIDLIQKIRKEVPGICLRTTLLVGFPGETEEDIDELEQFVRATQFDRLGVFSYSEEDGTYAAEHYVDDVPQEVKNQRNERIMSLQRQISAELNAQKIGRTMDVIIDKREGDYFVGRTQYDSPDVDGEVLIAKDEPLKIGQFYKAYITDANEYDLYATTIKE